MDKASRLSALHAEWQDCKRCGLCETRQNVVFGEGNPDARLMIVGEAPGAEEDKEGKPFIGEAGRVLNTFLRAAAINREEDVFITNTIACRPTRDATDPKTGKTFKENRVPSKEERACCKERLLETIYIIDPFLILALGKTALQSLLGKVNVITKMRGNVYTLHLQGRQTEVRYPVLAMYHPAFLARSFDYSNPEGVWFQTGKDFKMATQVVDYINSKYYGIERNRDAEIDQENTE